MSRYTFNNEESLRFQNELRKLKLRAEYGLNTPEINLSPQAEQRWLSDIELSARRENASDHVLFHTYVGCPEFLDSETVLHPAEWLAQLDNLLYQLAEHNIYVESEAGASARELYQFIIGDLFPMMILDVHNQLFVRRYVYEDFYPNAQQETKAMIKIFFNKIFSREWNFLEGVLANKVQTFKPTVLKRKELLHKLKLWVTEFEHIEMLDIHFIKNEVHEDQAIITAEISLETESQADLSISDSVVFTNFQLKKDEYGLWQVSGAYIPSIQ